MKRILSLTLALVMVLGTFTGVFAAEPTVEEAAGKFLESVGVLLGDDEGNLNLNENLERRDAVILLSRLLGAEEVAAEFPKSEESPSWTDVRTDEYYVSFFAWAEANGYFEGNDDNTFAPREAISAPEYALVLLRALGYEANGYESWKAALKTAKELGLLEDVEVEFEDKVVRGQMAVMTLNALGTKVKDSEKTLAETLEIELPEPEVLEIENVYADNLVEVKIAFNKDVDIDLTDLELYSIKGVTEIKDAFVDGSEVVLSVPKMINKKDYELTIKGAGDLDGKYEFKAYDNAAPYVVSVEALGTKAVKVVMSEPVKEAKASNFRLDGNRYFGSVDLVGRDIVLTPYNKVLTVGTHELSVSSLEDHANFKSLETIEEFEVVEDKVAPEVIDVTGTLERIVVTFSEAIDPDTVNNKTLYWNNKANTGKAVRLAADKYAFEFEGNKRLPIYEVTLHIQGAKDYSGNEMDAVEMAFKGVLDETRPEVVETFVAEKSDLKGITVRFSKSVKEGAEKTANYTVTDKNDKVVRVRSAKIDSDNDKQVNIVLYNALKEGESYTIKIEGVQDKTRLQNTMLPYEGTITVDGAAVEAKFEGAYGNKNEKTIQVTFSKEMDLATIANENSYVLSDVYGENSVLLSSFDDTDIDVINSGKAVIITIRDKDVTIGEGNVAYIAVLGARDTDDNLITNHGVALKIELDKTTISEATAESKTKIVIEFDQAIAKANADDFEIKYKGSKKDIITDVEVDGTKKVTLIVDKLTADAENYTINVKTKNGIETLLGNEAKESTEAIQLIDKIAPSLISVSEEVTVVDGVYAVIELEFDENLTTDKAYEDLFTQDITIINLNENKKLDSATDYELVKADGKVITLKIKEVVLEEEATVDYAITIESAGFIRDNSEKKNVANDTDEEFVVTVKSAE